MDYMYGSNIITREGVELHSVKRHEGRAKVGLMHFEDRRNGQQPRNKENGFSPKISEEARPC